MNLHRTNGQPDWEDMDPAEYNAYQRVAAATHGVVTPANLITLIGLGMVLVGLAVIFQQQLWVGLGLVLGGRLLDVIDGLVADKTRTKSPLGELWDATADKLGTLLTIVTLWYGGIVNGWVIVALCTPQLLIPLVVYINRRRGTYIHPTRMGKIGMATTWVSIGMLFAGSALGAPVVLMTAAYVVAALAVVMTIYALWQYTTGRD